MKHKEISMGYSKNEENHRKTTQTSKFSPLRGCTMKYSNIIRIVLSVPPEARKITIILTISKNI